MTFRITGLSPEPFRHLYGLSDKALAAYGAQRVVANADFGYPDRIEMRDAKAGERLILVNYLHQAADTPYRSGHAIFVLEGAEATYEGIDEVPDVIRLRPMSLRAFDKDHMMIDADVIDGWRVEDLIERLLADSRTDYIQAHYAKRGCFAARIDRFAGDDLRRG